MSVMCVIGWNSYCGRGLNWWVESGVSGICYGIVLGRK